MPNTNFQTILQMPGIVNDIVKQATGREAVSQIDMDFVTVGQDKQTALHEIDFDDTASFVNNNELPMSIIAKIAAVQAGTGNPSSENIRPISGWSGVNVWDDPKYDKPINWNQIVYSSANWPSSDNGYGTRSEGIVTVRPTSATKTYAAARASEMQTRYPYHVYFMKYTITEMSENVASAGLGFNGVITSITEPGSKSFLYKLNSPRVCIQAVISGSSNLSTSEYAKFSSAMCLDLTQIFGSTIAESIYSMETATTGAGVAYVESLFYKDAYDDNVGTVTCVSAVNGDPCRHRTVTFPDPPDTVYGGTLNLTTGILTVTHGYIASYVDETLPGEWISDRDVYAAGTTPTVGAEVVYVLAEPVTYELDPVEVKSMIGQNNVFADTGDIAVSYTSYIPVI